MPGRNEPVGEPGAERGRSRSSRGPQRSDESRLAILAAAEKVLDEGGPENFTVEAVARRAQASKLTIYKWWGDKETLVSEVYRLNTSLNCGQTGGVAARLVAIYSGIWNVWQRAHNATLTRWLFRAALKSNEATAKYRDGHLKHRFAPVAEILIAARRSGELSETCDIDLICDLLVGYNMLRVLLNRPVSELEMKASVEAILAGVEELASRTNR